MNETTYSVDKKGINKNEKVIKKLPPLKDRKD
jgi:hypothetical protein